MRAGKPLRALPAIIHGSDSAETASFELSLWFPNGGAAYKTAADPYLYE